MSQGWYRLSRRLTMAEVAAELEWVDEATGRPSSNDIRRARRWLRRVERQKGVQLLFGGGERGAECWTTMRALREACDALVEGEKIKAEDVERMKERLEEHDSRLRILGSTVASNQRRLKRIEARVGER